MYVKVLYFQTLWQATDTPKITNLASDLNFKLHCFLGLCDRKYNLHLA